MEEFEGYIENIIFHNEENGYTVADMVINDDKLITITGSMPYLYEGENICIKGEYKVHPNYGKQFNVVSYEKIEPKDTEAIEKYLSSGIFKGIGEVLAKRIVDKFREDTIDTIVHYPKRLVQVKGVSKKRALELSEEFKEQKDVRDIIIFLQSFGMSASFATRIYKEIGKDAKEKIEENPYILADKVTGIGFKTADRIAYKLGIEKNCEFRIKSGIKYVLQKSSQAGHTYLKKEELIELSANLLDASEDIVRTLIGNIVFEGSIINNDDRIYLTSLFEAEKNSAYKIYELTSTVSENSNQKLNSLIESYEKKEKISFDEKQKSAIKKALQNGLFVITGGPGTGKTTIIRCILYILEELNKTFALCAPTGRAAKRMEEATNKEAKTIHRLLEIGYQEGSSVMEFRRNAANPLEYNYIIIDEVSMVDIMLLSSLLTAVTNDTRLIFVGDKDQLPSVGPGSVLKSMLFSECVPNIMLDKIFRHDPKSLIAVNAHRINTGKMPVIDNNSNDFFLVNNYRKESIKKIIAKMCLDKLPNKYNYNWMDDISILTPVRKGELGVAGLNEYLKEAFNPMSKKKKEIKFANLTYREGDRVMQIKNNYNLKWYKYNNLDITGEGVYNGDIGYVESVDLKDKKLEVVFDNERVVIYDKNTANELEIAFASTIHKSQGSEFNVIIIPLFNAPRILLTRNLLYTAITRARQMVILIGDERIIKIMVDNQTQNKRNESLDIYIKEYFSHGN